MPPDTGAREVARKFFEFVVRQEWAEAYFLLDRECRARQTPEQFAGRARSYRRNLGFEPQRVRVRSCAEKGAEAIAHVVFSGRTETRQRQYKDGLTLRKGDSGWGVVVPAHFGRGRDR